MNNESLDDLKSEVEKAGNSKIVAIVVDYLVIRAQQHAINGGKTVKNGEIVVVAMVVLDAIPEKINAESGVHYVDYGKVVKRVFNELVVEIYGCLKGNVSLENKLVLDDRLTVRVT